MAAILSIVGARRERLEPLQFGRHVHQRRAGVVSAHPQAGQQGMATIYHHGGSPTGSTAVGSATVSERISHDDMLQRVAAAREGWQVPGAYLVQAHDDAMSLNRIADELVAERDQLRKRAEAAEAALAKLQLDYIDTANGAVMERQRAEAAEVRVKELEVPATARLLHAIRDYVPAADLLKDQDREIAFLHQKIAAAEAKLAAIPVDALINMLNPGGAVNEDADRIEMWIRELKNTRR